MTAPSARPILEGAEPFSYAGTGSVGALLVHGFTGSPYEMRPIGEHLASRGIGSEAVLLKGHGTHPDDMLDARHTDWLADIESALDRLLGTYAHVFLIGLSMGGTLALHVAARRGDDPRLAGVVAIGAPVQLDDWRLRGVRWASKIIRWHIWGRPDIKDPSAWDAHVSYKKFRTQTLIELLTVMSETLALLPRVRQPLLVMQARQDHVVPAYNAPLILDGVSSEDKRLVWLENSYHVATVDYDAPQLNEAIASFVEAWTVAEARESVAEDRASAGGARGSVAATEEA